MKGLLIALSLMAAAEAGAHCPRIVSQAPYITHSLRWLGLERCIVGVSRYDPLKRPRTGGVLDPDADAIARLRPQLLLNADWIDQPSWRAAAPPDAQAERLGGFGSMAEVEQNLRRLGELTGLPDAARRAADFGRAWQRAAQAVKGHGTVLIVAGCGGQPYVFGAGTYLRELFTAAGFQPAGDISGVEQLQGRQALDALIGQVHPEWVFLLRSRGGPHHCPALTPREATRFVPLDGELFFHPAPILLEGLSRLGTVIEERSGEDR